MIYQKFSKRQILAMTWWNRPAFREKDAIVADGAVRSGKTLCMTVGFFVWSMSTFTGETFGLCGRSISSLRRNVVMNLQNWLGDLMQIQEHRADSKITVHYGERVNTYYLFGGLDESSYKQIQGITLAGAFLDEVALMPRSFVEQTCARCSVAGSKLWFNCNPAGPDHWFYKEWICKAAEKRVLRLRFSMDDNLALDPNIRKRYESIYEGVFYRRYIQGEWCVAEGLIYSFNKKLHMVAGTEIQAQHGRWYISVDYGTLNPFSAGLWWLHKGKAIRVAEYYYSGRAKNIQKTDEEYYNEIEKLAGDRDIQCVIVDPSAASFIATIRKHGRFAVRKAKNDVLSGIRLTATMLKAGVIKISDQCPDAIREFGLYRWDERGEVDRPVKENDHAMDDIRYFCATVLRRNPETREITGGDIDAEEV